MLYSDALLLQYSAHLLDAGNYLVALNILQLKDAAVEGQAYKGPQGRPEVMSICTQGMYQRPGHRYCLHT